MLGLHPPDEPRSRSQQFPRSARELYRQRHSLLGQRQNAGTRITLSLPLLVMTLWTSACTSVRDISNRECVPLATPIEVTTLRPTFLYNYDRDGELELWDHLYKYKIGGDPELIIDAPLMELPPGTRIRIDRVTRETGFDGPWDAIIVYGVIDTGGSWERVQYVWGVGNKIKRAPWETSNHEPRRFDRTVDC